VILDPDKNYDVRDDAQVRMFLERLGELADLDQPNTEGPFPQARILGIYNHETHWIIAIRWLQQSRIADNGYGVFCFSKKNLSRAAFEKELEAQKKFYFPNGPADSSWTKTN
jgi:hypothetical protein